MVVLSAATLALFMLEYRGDPGHAEHETNWLIDRAGLKPNRISLQRDDRALEFSHEGGQWRQSSGEAGDGPPLPLNDAFVQERLKVLLAARVERIIASGSPAERYRAPGVDLGLSVSSGDNELLSLVAGRITPDRYGRYFFRQPQGDVITLPEFQYQNLLCLFEAQ